MKPIIKFSTFVLVSLLSASIAHASLVIKVESPRKVGNKSVIKLKLRNEFKEQVESARATVFLLDDQGKVVGQATRWVIGGTKDKIGLAPDATADYSFVIENDKPFMTTKVTFSRIILGGGEIVGPTKGFEITTK